MAEEDYFEENYNPSDYFPPDYFPEGETATPATPPTIMFDVRSEQLFVVLDSTNNIIMRL